MKEKTRFDLEQEILGCWGIVDDIKVFVDCLASPEDFLALSRVYEIRFQNLQNTFEQLVDRRKIT